MTSLPYWAQWLQLGGTFVLAGFAAFIAYRQWRTAHQRVVLDLFERRMALYEETREALASIVRNGRADGATYFNYCKAIDRISILFGNEVVVYANDTRQRVNQMVMHSDMLASNELGHEERKHHANKSAELMTEFLKFYDVFPRLLAPYVRMTQKL